MLKDDHDAYAHHDHDHDHEHGHSHGSRPHKPGILLAAFGAALPEACLGFDLFEGEVRERFPDVHTRWAFTAHKIRRKLEARGMAQDSLAVALSRMYDEGVTHLVVQSLHTVPGVEYHWTLDQSMAHLHPRKGFEQIVLGGPLLHSDDDLARACAGLQGYIPTRRTPDEAVVLVGHGTYHEGHKRYLDFEACVRSGDPKIFVGALMGRPNCADIIERLKASGVERVHLLPFMSVPGHHVRVDICGGHTRSWKHRLEDAGFHVEAHIAGTLEHTPFRKLWLSHLDEAFSTLDVRVEAVG